MTFSALSERLNYLKSRVLTFPVYYVEPANSFYREMHVLETIVTLENLLTERQKFKILRLVDAFPDFWKIGFVLKRTAELRKILDCRSYTVLRDLQNIFKHTNRVTVEEVYVDSDGEERIPDVLEIVGRTCGKWKGGRGRSKGIRIMFPNVIAIKKKLKEN